MSDELNDRLRAVERAIGDEFAAADQPSGCDVQRAEPTGRPELAARIETVETSLAELEGAVQALRGYGGSVRSVNERVERRADAALAAVDSLTDRVDSLEARDVHTLSSTVRETAEVDDSLGVGVDDSLGVGVDDSLGIGVDDTSGAGVADRVPGRPTRSNPELEWPTPSPPPHRAPAPDDDRERPGLVARLREVL
ncbi:DUF7310 family coiled-coil domain-containing protein [Haloarchaeobius sp. TZWWS8]|uniref:DUF7310 family coiled-coil domain-containing protein n=1 Tax=Haloarchaeobius sp. TZWWS8 TaxID=3446121 RepID=UPI003EBF0FB6